jgi:hypothetical protein
LPYKDGTSHRLLAVDRRTEVVPGQSQQRWPEQDGDRDDRAVLGLYGVLFLKSRSCRNRVAYSSGDKNICKEIDHCVSGEVEVVDAAPCMNGAKLRVSVRRRV